MPGFEEHDLGVRIVPLEGFGSGREKKRIGVAPHGERWGPMGAEVLLELRIQFDVAGGIGLSHNAPDYFIGTGLSIRLLN